MKRFNLVLNAIKIYVFTRNNKLNFTAILYDDFVSSSLKIVSSLTKIGGLELFLNFQHAYL